MKIYKTAVISSIREETPGVKTFAIISEDGTSIPYAAGQFITFAFVHHGREERRSFSISSSPALSEQLSFTVKRIDNGAYSRLLIDRAKVGDKLFTTGAAGLFTLPENMDAYGQVFFFAAGIGITPVYSLIKTLLHKRPEKQVVLIYSNGSREEVVFYNELNELAKKFRNKFKVEFLYSTSFDLARARLSKALLPILLNEYAVVPQGRMLFYICGPFAYMRMAIISLEEQGINEDQIKKENFNTNDRVIKKATPPDTTAHHITIKMDGKEYTFPVQYPDTILQAAKKNGLALPYSCEVGRCGSCAALCTKGTVWLSYNEVLMDSDLKQGKILTCVGHPIGGDVAIEV
jgi:ferredoxin-NADP reductase